MGREKWLTRKENGEQIARPDKTKHMHGLMLRDGGRSRNRREETGLGR